MKKSLKEKIAFQIACIIRTADERHDREADRPFFYYCHGLSDAEAITLSQECDLLTICSYFVKIITSSWDSDLDIDELYELYKCVSDCGMTYDDLLDKSGFDFYITGHLEKTIGHDYIRLLRQEEGVTEKEVFSIVCDF